jgi:hypothetical protein
VRAEAWLFQARRRGAHGKAGVVEKKKGGEGAGAGRDRGGGVPVSGPEPPGLGWEARVRCKYAFWPPSV